MHRDLVAVGYRVIWVTLAVAVVGLSVAPSQGRTIRVGQAPYPTLQSAVDAVPELRPTLSSGETIEILLPTGVTRLTTPVLIDKAHGGTADHPLVIRSDAGAPARLSGSMTLPVRAARAGDTPGIDLPAGTVALDLSSYGGPVVPNSRGAAINAPANSLQLYQGVHWLRTAAWPGDDKRAFTASGTNASGPLIALLANAPRTLAIEPAPWAEGYWGADWEFESAPITRITGGIAQVAPLRAAQPLRTQVRLRFTNLVGALAPGRYALLPNRRLALLVPTTDSADAPVEVSVTEGLLRMDGATQVTLRDITFERSGGDAVRITRSIGILIDSCTVAQVGGNGIVVSGGRDVTVRNTRVTMTGERGMLIGGGDRATLTAANHRIEGGAISDFGMLSPSYRPAVSLWGVGLTVTGVRIRGGDHAGIVIDGNNQLVEANDIGAVLRDTDDAGAIYLGADWSKRGNRIVGNMIHDLGDAARPARQLVGIYLDDQIAGTTVKHNTVRGGNYGMLIGGGRDNRIADNQFLNPTSGGIWIDARGTNTQRARLPEFWSKLIAMPLASAAWQRAYPGLATNYDDATIASAPTGNILTGNSVTGNAPLLVGPQAARALLRTQ